MSRGAGAGELLVDIEAMNRALHPDDTDPDDYTPPTDN